METISQVSVQLNGGVAPYTVLLVYSVADQLAQVPMVNPAQAGAAGTWYASLPLSAIPRSAIGANGQATIVLQAKAIDASNTTTGLIDAGLLIVKSC